MPPKKIKSKSFVWKYFIKCENGGGSCKICHKSIKTSGNTTNLISHLKHVHKDIYKLENEDETVSSGELNNSRPSSAGPGTNNISADESDGVTDLEINSNFSREMCSPDNGSRSSLEEFSNNIQRSRRNQSLSSITGHFNSIHHGSLYEFQSAAQSIDVNSPSTSALPYTSTPRKRQNINKPVIQRNQLIETAFANINSYNEGGAKALKITNAILFMIAKDNLPLNTTEKDGFRFLMNAVAPMYKIPSRKLITQHIDEKYEVLSDIFKKKMESVTNFTITTDIWTETMNTQAYLGVTAHFIQKNTICSAMICVAPLDERHSAELISHHLKNICNEWNIKQEKIVAVVSDNAANMTKAITDTFGKEKHLPCFAHTISLVAQGAISNAPEFRALISKVKDIVRFFKQSVSAADELRKYQIGQPAIKLIQDVSTRWNSTYYMLDRFFKLKEQIGAVLLKLPKSPDMLNGFEISIIEDAVKILSPLEKLTKEICGDKFITSSKIIPLISCMNNNLNSIVTKTPVSKELKEILLQQICKRFQHIEKVHLLAFSTILDPRFKKIHFKDQIACAKAIQGIDKQLKVDIAEKLSPTHSKDIDSSTTNPGAESNTDLWGFHQQLVNTATAQHNASASVDGMYSGLTQYLAQPILDLKTDPLNYWSIHKIIHPELTQIAEKYLSVTATSVSSERLFSRAGNIMEESRNRIHPDRLNKILFLNSLQINDWCF